MECDNKFQIAKEIYHFVPRWLMLVCSNPLLQQTLSSDDNEQNRVQNLVEPLDEDHVDLTIFRLLTVLL